MIARAESSPSSNNDDWLSTRAQHNSSAQDMKHTDSTTQPASRRMGKFDDLARRLRARVDRSSNRENSLDWKAANAIEQLSARQEMLEVENKRLDAENQALHKGNQMLAPTAAQQMASQESPSALTRAIDLREAASLLSVSYSTVYAHKEEIGFFQIGNQWRVWPDTLRENLRKQTDQKAVHSGPGKPGPAIKSGQKSKADVPMSVARAARELDELLAQIRPKRRR